MPVTAQCENCSAKFKAKDTMAGKRVGCPKCKQPMRIPDLAASAPAPAPVAPAAPAPSAAQYNPILDLLDEEGVKAAPTGPVCNNCGTEMQHRTVICIECGFNAETGEKLKTEVFHDENEIVSTGKSDAEKLMAKAEKEIEGAPAPGDGEDFGDGGDSYIIALAAIIGFIVLAGLGLTIVLSMDWIMESFGLTPPGISFVMSIVIAIGCISWITTVAFLSDQKQGIICLCTLGFYCVIFGFTQGSKLLMPTIGLLASGVIGLVSWLVMAYGGEEDASLLIDSAFALLGG